MRRRDSNLSDRFSSFLQERASFELREEDLGELQTRFGASTLNSLASPSTSAAPAFRTKVRDEEEYRAWKAKYPCLLTHFELFTKQAENKRVAVFLDYDGTLTPIVKNPDRAFMSDQMRAQVQAVAQLFPTAIISGRGREKVESFVQLKELYYAGSHGMDIVGPRVGDANGGQLAFQPAAEFEPVMDTVHAMLVHRVQDIEGASVEHNKFCVSVHFRNCAPSSWDAVVTAVETTLKEHPQLKATRGRKVLEIRPQVDWDKGRALSHLLTALGLDAGEDVLAIYIGDDRTDEDAFSVLNEQAQGFGILVSSKAKATQAKYTLRDPAEVMAFLTALVDWGYTSSNAWHNVRSCTGWQLKASLRQPSRDPAQLTERPQQCTAVTGSSSPRASAACPPHTGVAWQRCLAAAECPSEPCQRAAVALGGPGVNIDQAAPSSHHPGPGFGRGLPPLVPQIQADTAGPVATPCSLQVSVSSDE